MVVHSSYDSIKWYYLRQAKANEMYSDERIAEFSKDEDAIGNMLDELGTKR